MIKKKYVPVFQSENRLSLQNKKRKKNQNSKNQSIKCFVKFAMLIQFAPEINRNIHKQNCRIRR